MIRAQCAGSLIFKNKYETFISIETISFITGVLQRNKSVMKKLP